MGALIAQSGMISHAVAVYDPDAQALFAAFTGTPSEKLKTAINNYILKMKDPARWDSGLGAIWNGTTFMACAQGVDTNEHDRLLIWNNPTLSIVKTTASGSTATTSESEGFVAGNQPVGPGGAAPPFALPPIDDFNGAYKQNSAGVSFYVTKAATPNGAGFWLANGSSALILKLCQNTGATYRIFGWVQSTGQTTGANTGGVEPAVGDEISMSRSAAAVSNIIQNGVSGATATGASSATPPGVISLFANFTTTWGSASTGSKGRIWVGRNITAAENAMLRQIHNEYLAELAS